MTTPDPIDALCDTYIAETGCSPEEATELIAYVCAAWKYDPAKLPAIVRQIAGDRLTISDTLLTLYGMQKFRGTSAGCETLMFGGLIVARQCGLDATYVTQLQAITRPPPSETSH